MFSRFLHLIGLQLARFLSKPIKSHYPAATISYEKLLGVLRPGDVLLVEGFSRLSITIQYLTQSSWSHSALYVGDMAADITGDASPMLIEADVQEGVRLTPLRAYAHMHTRVCRPVGVSKADLAAMITEAKRHVGDRYDLRNVFDLARYSLPIFPVPARWRRKMIALGSGKPTEAICSTLIAKLFNQIHYPILPEIEHLPAGHPSYLARQDEILHIRHYSPYTPRDFDISPYFEIIKPRLPPDFDYRTLHWADPAS